MTDNIKTPTDAELESLAARMIPIHSRHWIETNAFARAVPARWGAAPTGEPECTCAAADMPMGTCCKVRTAFEKWYDRQNDGRLQPFDVFKGGWVERHRLSAAPAEPPRVPLIEQIAQQWDGCMYDAPGGEIDIGQAIRSAAHGITTQGDSNAE